MQTSGAPKPTKVENMVINSPLIRYSRMLCGFWQRNDAVVGLASAINVNSGPTKEEKNVLLPSISDIERDS